MFKASAVNKKKERNYFVDCSVLALFFVDYSV
jgi:hypothetical protein